MEGTPAPELEEEAAPPSTGKLWAIARIDLGLTDDEFLSMIPAALELLMRRLEVHDRKSMFSGAMVSAELWNIAFAGSETAREKHPESFTASDFLPELPEERMRREREYARAQALAALPPSAAELAAYKARLFVGLPKKAGG